MSELAAAPNMIVNFGFYAGRSQQSSNHENAWIIISEYFFTETLFAKFLDKIVEKFVEAL